MRARDWRFCRPSVASTTRAATWQRPRKGAIVKVLLRYCRWGIERTEARLQRIVMFPAHEISECCPGSCRFREKLKTRRGLCGLFRVRVVDVRSTMQLVTYPRVCSQTTHHHGEHPAHDKVSPLVWLRMLTRWPVAPFLCGGDGGSAARRLSKLSSG